MDANSSEAFKFSKSIFRKRGWKFKVFFKSSATVYYLVKTGKGASVVQFQAGNNRLIFNDSWKGFKWMFSNNATAQLKRGMIAAEKWLKTA
ncbi:MAG: hypothetical protein ABW007_19415 [Chitinophagaceae bacterium]